MTSIYCRDPDGNLVEIAAYDGPAVEDRGLGLVVRLRNAALCKDSRSTESAFRRLSVDSLKAGIWSAVSSI